MNWSDLLVFVAGILAKVAFDLLSDYSSRRLKDFILRRAKSRFAVTSIPDIPKEFHCFRVGNLEIPVMSLVGSPETVFHFDEVDVSFQPILRHQQAHYPIELLSARSYLTEECKRRYNLKMVAEDNLLPRIDSIVQGPETEDDKRGNLYINLSLSTFSTYFVTNKSLDHRVIPRTGWISRFISNQTIREAYVVPPYDNLAESLLANCPAVHVAVISRNLNQNPQDQLIIRRRSQDVAFYRGYYQVSATGFVSMAHHDSAGIPNPFIAAISEAKQEIADSLSLSPNDFKLIGVSINWEEFVPVFYGYVETGISVRDLLGDFRRDVYEGSLLAIPFDPESVLSHIMTKEKWESSSAIAAVATLLAFYPRAEVEAVARKLPAKSARDFFEIV
jgi:hypothetical protein